MNVSRRSRCHSSKFLFSKINNNISRDISERFQGKKFLSLSYFAKLSKLNVLYNVIGRKVLNVELE
jgi:hypothetical protein